MKLKLDLEELAEEFFDGSRLLGIVAPIKDYRFCWLLNQKLRFDFRMKNDIEIQLTKKGRQYFFAVYEYQEPSTSLCHYLYNNQFDGEYLLPEFRHLDFLWLMKGDIPSSELITHLTTSLKSLPGVQLVMELTTEQIRNKGHLIF